MRQERRNGFTLVELTIVLVIIGLLIGGILAAQSMISASKIVAVAAQVQQFDAGVGNFKSQYNYLPGEAPAFNGNGNGVIAYTSAALNIAIWNACEIGNFWNSLDSTLYPVGSVCGGNPPGLLPSTSGASKNAPEAKIGKKGSYFIASGLSIDGGFADVTSPQNFYAILSKQQVAFLSPWNAFVTSSISNQAVSAGDLLSLDTKIDDGLANSGNVLSGSIGNYLGWGIGGAILATPFPACSTGSTYTLSTTSDYKCTPLIRIGAQVGDPQ